uniref:Uncharacterized protein n=1 Tax=Caenorhabditis japonica TaxID=281687 RepID=A0A8R1ESK2_CAEJA
MPFFGSKKEKKEKCTGDAPMYPRQQAPPPPQVGHYPPMGNTYPQGSFVNQTDQFYYNPTGQFQSAPASGPSYTMAFVRNDLPGSQENWAEGFLDGPDFSNRVPDRSIPPAPGSYYFYSVCLFV